MNLLDLFAGVGGAGEGYARAGWTVTGVELNRSRARHYPYAVHVGDALTYLREHGHRFEAIHASPPCQFYTRGNAPRRGTRTKWKRTIPPVRAALEETGRPYVIENVPDAHWDMRDPVALCGCMFGLAATDTDGLRIHLRRARLFETNWPLAAPRPCDHAGQEWVGGVYGGARRDKQEAKHVRRGGYVPPDKSVAMALMGVDHPVTWAGLFEALPPAYTEHVGREMAEAL